MAKKDKIAILGGTFNPPHNGHIHLLKAFSEEFDFDKILIIPTAVPPHKEVKELASGEQRLKMCELAFEGCEICDYEIKRGGKNYTADTLDYLKSVYPESRFYFIMGTDMLLSFASWRDPERIIKNAVLLCDSRESRVSADELRRFAKEKLELDETRCIISDVKPLEISSTEVRERIKNGESVEKLLPQRVREYIEKEGLYA